MNYDPRFQLHFLAYSLRDTYFLSKVAERLSADFFTDEAMQRVARLILEFYGQWKKAPDEMIFQELDRLKEKGLISEETHKTVSRYIDELFRYKLENKEYFLTEAENFFWQKEIESKILILPELLEKNKIEETEELFRDLLKTRQSKEKELYQRGHDAAEFMSQDYKAEYLVKGVLAARQPCIIGGREKTLKTSIATDLAVSLATETKFLNQFSTRRSKVVMWSGESGEAKLQASIQNICKTRGVATEELRGWFSIYPSAVPKCGLQKHLDDMRQIVVASGFEVVILDPLYMCLQGSKQRNSGDLYDMGAAFAPLKEWATELGVTLILVHHARKNGAASNSFQPIQLQELTQSGACEFARQWILLSRREMYDHKGNHSLWLSIGGSQGHDGEWGLDVTEGPFNPELGRHEYWGTRILDREELGHEKQTVAILKQSEHEDKIMEALKYFEGKQGGATQRDLAAKTGIKYIERDYLYRWEESGKVELTEIKKSNGKGFRTIPAWKAV